jgi:hypothetical protein
MITGESDIRVQTVSPQAAYEKLNGTPMQQWADVFIRLSNNYSIDLNWILSYLQWETGFGGAGGRHPSMDFNDPWDMLCASPGQPCNCAPIFGASGVVTAPNGYCYYTWPTMEAGIEAGYKNWKSYIDRGWTNWFSSLSVSLCGNPAGCSGEWVQNVINQANYNASHWPYQGQQQPQGNPRCFVQPESNGTFSPVYEDGHGNYSYINGVHHVSQQAAEDVVNNDSRCGPRTTISVPTTTLILGLGLLAGSIYLAYSTGSLRI